MGDIDVRNALRRKVLKKHEGEADTRVLDELGLRHGVARIDIALVNGSLHGFEIKSELLSRITSIQGGIVAPMRRA